MRHIGLEQTIKAEGKTFRLSRFTRRLLRQWLEWADTYLESPLAIAEEHFDGWPEPDILVAAAENLLLYRYSFNDPAVAWLWLQPEGIKQAFRLMLATCHPDVNPEPIIRELGIRELERLIAKANGIPPNNPAEIERAYFTALGLLEVTEPPFVKSMDWGEFDKSLFQNLHLTPDQIDNLTPTEITVLCKSDDDKRSMSDAIQIANLQRQITPKQMLELARLKHA